jgi:excisionase family DNA binding protein
VGEERTGQPGATNQRVTVPEAAELLGITVEAVRMRIKRGTLRSERQGGRVFVLLGQSQPTDRPDEPTTLISEMRSRIQFLEDELQRKDAILLNMTEAMKALSPPPQEASSDERESPETAEHQQGRGDVSPEPQAATSRPWWRRIIGG